MFKKLNSYKLNTVTKNKLRNPSAYIQVQKIWVSRNVVTWRSYCNL